MEISLTVILCLATGIVSWQAFSNSVLFSKLSFSPYRVKHNKEIYRIWSHTLVHADMGHLFFNLYALFSFGREVEDKMSLELFAFLYLGAAAFASLPALKKHGDNIYYTSVGASGAVSAVMILFMFMNPDVRLLFFFILPLPGWAGVLLFFGLEYYMNKKMKTGIAHDAHLAGAAFGIAFLLIWNPQAFIHFFEVVSHSILN